MNFIGDAKISSVKKLRTNSSDFWSDIRLHDVSKKTHHVLERATNFVYLVLKRLRLHKSFVHTAVCPLALDASALL